MQTLERSALPILGDVAVERRLNRNHKEGRWCGFRPARNTRLACVTGLKSRNRPILAEAPEDSGPSKPRSRVLSVAIG